MTSRATARQNLSDAIRRGVVSVIDALHVPQAVYGTVTAISTTTQTCTITQQGSAGTTAGVKSISSYVPAVGDTVVCWRVGTDLWIQGKIGGPLTGVELSRLDYLNPSNYSLSSANFVNPVQIDGAHLAMPAFTVPASGKMVWTFECLLSSPATGVNIYVMPYDTTLGHLGTFSIFSQQASPALVVHREFVFSATPGTRILALQPSYTVDSGTATIYGNGGSIGAIVQTVRAA